MDTLKISRNTSRAKWRSILVLSTFLRVLLGPLLVTMSISYGDTQTRLGLFSYQADDPAGAAPFNFSREIWKGSTWSVSAAKEGAQAAARWLPSASLLASQCAAWPQKR